MGAFRATGGEGRPLARRFGAKVAPTWTSLGYHTVSPLRLSWLCCADLGKPVVRIAVARYTRQQWVPTDHLMTWEWAGGNFCTFRDTNVLLIGFYISSQTGFTINGTHSHPVFQDQDITVMALLPSAVIDAFLWTLKAFGSSNHLLQDLMTRTSNRKQGLESVEVFKDTVCLHSRFSRPLSPHC